MTDKRDLIINQAKEILLNMLKDHADNEFCAYAYLELTLGKGVKQRDIDYVKEEILRLNGTFRIKKVKSDGKYERYSMEDLLGALIYCLNISLRERVLVDREGEILGKYGAIAYFDGIEYYLKETLLGIKSDYSDKYHSDFEKMIEEYILRA